MTLLTRRLVRHVRPATTQRSLWTRVSSTAPTLKACIDQCLASLPSNNNNNSDNNDPPTVCFAMFSKSFQGDDYTAAIKDLTQRWGENSSTCVMGCIVDRTASTNVGGGDDGHGVNLLVGYDELIQPFQVLDSPQRQKARSISVGRWGQVHDFDRFKYEDNTLDTLGWDSFQTISRPPQQHVHVLNDDPTTTSAANNQQPAFILMASDHEPDQVLHSLDQVYPTTPKLGVIGASTPFVTGEPYTFFYQGQIMHAGMVGFAAYHPTTPILSQMTVQHPDLEPLGSTFEITRARGNIILDLDDQGATRRLLDLIHQGKIAKDEAFYLAMHQQEDTIVARITSGDPSRGNMAVDTTLDLKVGQKVQFMKRKTEGALEPHDLLDSSKNHSMVFGVVDLDHTIDAMGISRTTKNSSSSSGHSQVFGATSENGMIVGKPGRPSRLVQVPFSIVTVD